MESYLSTLHAEEEFDQSNTSTIPELETFYSVPCHQKGSSGEESSQTSSSPGEERSDGIAVGHSGREELQQANRSQQTATIEEGESSQRPSPSTAEGRGDGFRLPQGRDRSNQSQDESYEEECSESPSCTDEQSEDGIVFENSGEETGRSNQSQLQQPETSGEERSSNRQPSLAGESGDDVIVFRDSETGQDSDQQDAISFNEGESRQDNQRRLLRGNEEESDESHERIIPEDIYIQTDLMDMTLWDYIRRRNEGYLEKKRSALSSEDREGNLLGPLLGCWFRARQRRPEALQCSPVPPKEPSPMAMPSLRLPLRLRPVHEARG
ncbi:unnamed protein product [Cyprideis torosa]|uniref:Uncharacterized protein n=1 Tax=Cyprideis torosa TaxID=163714 RepID=A0A7R8WIZ3_9CRUS|nr:unnamed protein product [Cyprideis torosa]CAG0901250.1 unnamed protein product [Cyprideis torosa]